MTSGAVLLVAGFVLAGGGGELFVRGLLRIARWSGIAPGVVAITVAAFATSAPELSVSVSAALDGRPRIGLGDAIGSNVVNVALVFAIALAVGPITVGRGSVGRDFSVALLAPILSALLIADGELSRTDGILLIALFLAWLVLAIRGGANSRNAAGDGVERGSPYLALLFCLIGFGLLIGAGRFIVLGGVAVGQTLGLSPFATGAAIVALGTSMPELATAIIAGLRGHRDIGLGTILGSNIFNGLLIVPLVAIIHPVEIVSANIAIALGFGALAVALIYPWQGVIQRGRFPVLLILYIAFLLVMAESPL